MSKSISSVSLIAIQGIVLAVIEKDDAVLGHDGRRPAFSQHAVEVAWTGQNGFLDFSVFIHFRCPVDKVVGRGNVYILLAPIHPVLAIYLRYDLAALLINLRYDGCRLGKHVFKLAAVCPVEG